MITMAWCEVSSISSSWLTWIHYTQFFGSEWDQPMNELLCWCSGLCPCVLGWLCFTTLKFIQLELARMSEENGKEIDLCSSLEMGMQKWKRDKIALESIKPSHCIWPSTNFFYSLSIVLLRQRGWEKERNMDLLFHLFMHSMVYACMSPDWGSNPQCWSIGTML